MRVRRTLSIGLICSVLSIVSVLAGTTVMAGGRQEGPSRPLWVRADGSVDMTRAPEQLPVVGSNGEALRDANGRPVMEDLRQLPSTTPPHSADGDLAGSVHLSERSERVPMRRPR
jgi:hypothetical protein